MSKRTAEQDLPFAKMALAMDLIGLDELAAVLQKLRDRKDMSLGRLLVLEGCLSEEALAMVDRLVREQVDSLQEAPPSSDPEGINSSQHEDNASVHLPTMD